MKIPTPFLVLLFRERRAHMATKRRLKEAIHERETARAKCSVLAHELSLTRRDADLLALMAKDRPTALAFIRDAHRLDQGPRSAP